MAKEQREGGGGRGDRREGGGRRRDREEPREQSEFQEAVVKISRTAAVVKGGRRFSFSALVVVGNRRGKIGFALGKANEVPNAVEKGRKNAIKAAKAYPLAGHTIPHEVEAHFGASKVLLKPAKPGTGLIAGAGVRAVVELLGISDIVSKAHGSTNPLNLIKAAMAALGKLRTRKQVEALRGVVLEELGEYPEEKFQTQAFVDNRVERPPQRGQGQRRGGRRKPAGEQPEGE